MLLFEWALPSFLLVFIRLTSFFLIAPIFSSRGVPNQFKIGFSFFLAILVTNVVGIYGNVSFEGNFLLLVIKEVFIGVSLGFVAALFLYAIQNAGGFIDMQMGFAIANVIDPQTGAQTPIMGNFKYMVAILFLLSSNGHHLLLRGILNSYFLVPIDQWIQIGSGTISSFFIHTFIKTFIIAVQIAAPIIAALFLVDVAMGVIARTVPQLNVFVVGIPLKILTSFIVLFLVLPGFFFLLNRLFTELFRSMNQLTELLMR